MRAAVLLALAVCAPGCQLVFKLEDVPDRFPHVQVEDEFTGDVDLDVPAGDRYTLDTESLDVSGNNFQDLAPVVAVQDGVGSDLVLLRVRRLIVNGELVVTGKARPLVILAEAIEISGTIDVSAEHTIGGPGGALSNANAPGQGGFGDTDGVFGGNNSGGGGGAFAAGAADGGMILCAARSVDGGPAGAPAGDDELRVLVGGGAGGRGGSMCTTVGVVAEGGGGGGAIQLSANESITINGGSVLTGGGGGEGGLGTSSCSADGGGAGGGAGGAIYLDAPTISSDGFLTAHGGGGGAGGKGGVGGSDGQAGFNATADAPNASSGGFKSGKGTSGGHGANPSAAAGEPGDCSAGVQPLFNTGGGGGAPGRIVVRGEVDQIGTVSPPPKLIDRPQI